MLMALTCHVRRLIDAHQRDLESFPILIAIEDSELRLRGTPFEEAVAQIGDSNCRVTSDLPDAP
jgi:hypothetical protein